MKPASREAREDSAPIRASGAAKGILRYRAWILLGLVVLLVAVVRIRLREMPLERDEGEYAYAGQLMLQGIPPYKMAYNMKLPGTYAAYALVMLVFGQTGSGVHLGLLALNVASILMLFFLGRTLLDEDTGLVAAVSFAFLSLAPTVLGMQAHASHFAAFFALVGALLLLRGIKTMQPAGSRSHLASLFGSGFCFGLAVLMKQPAIFWGLFGLACLVWNDARGERGWTWRSRDTRRWMCFGLGLAMPLLLTCAILWAAGVFPKFIFWTFTYASTYASEKNLFGLRSSLLHELLDPVIGPMLLFWTVAAVGIVVVFWEKRLENYRFFTVGFAAASLLAVFPGWYFRPHYFVFALPGLALLNGVAISRAIRLLTRDRTIELFLCLGTLGMFAAGVAYSLVEHGAYWFDLSPVEASRQSYLWQMFPEIEELADDIRKNSPPSARIAVLGSEPQIYFYARRHSATGYIYTFALMELHRHALRMQEEMIREIEAVKPEYLIFVKLEESWSIRAESELKIMKWYEQYTRENYDLVKTVAAVDQSPIDDPHAPGRTPGLILLFQRKGVPGRLP
jgi:4-amino-4-deoxy-L-arabinose transferase-like glycosyltransferase